MKKTRHLSGEEINIHTNIWNTDNVEFKYKRANIISDSALK